MADAVMEKKITTFEMYKDKRCHVVGIGRSGVASANLLSMLGAEVSISDAADKGSLQKYLGHLEKDIHAYPGRQDTGLVHDVDMLVLSPGVPSDIELAQFARQNGAEVIGEIELSYRVLQALREEAGFAVRLFAVTGTNGKSTTSTLLFEMVRRANSESILAGNIGAPLAGEAVGLLRRCREEDMKGKQIDIVLELSSFQLETIKEFSPDISALLNITPDHMDRYGKFEDYVRAKGDIFMNQGPGQIAVINADDPLAMRVSGQCRALKYYVSTAHKVEGISLDGDDIVITIAGDTKQLAPRADVLIPGLHNLYNAMTASFMAYMGGVSPDLIADTLRTFKGLEHRIELAGEKEGVLFYNDSKGTNVGAVIKSLESFERGVILIAGGRDKNSDFTLLRPSVEGRVKKAVLIGEAAERIGSTLGDLLPVEYAKTMDEAVRAAIAAAVPGDIVLLSPACASFDMFSNYEDRGDKFKEAVQRLIGEQK